MNEFRCLQEGCEINIPKVLPGERQSVTCNDCTDKIVNDPNFEEKAMKVIKTHEKIKGLSEMGQWIIDQNFRCLNCKLIMMREGVCKTCTEEIEKRPNFIAAKEALKKALE